MKDFKKYGGIHELLDLLYFAFTLAIGERLLQRLSYPIDFKEETT